MTTLSNGNLSKLVVVAVVAVVLTAGTAVAGSVTLTWDANTEPDVAGYTVFYGTQSGVYTSSVVVGVATSWTATTLTAGVKYYFAVQAVNADGLASPLSAEVSTTVARTSPTGESQASWQARFGVADMAADGDQDGVSNQAEFEGGTDPWLANVQTFTEGCAGFFRSRLAVVNPGTDEAAVTVRFLRESGAPVELSLTVAGQSRTAVELNGVAGLESGAFATVVTATRGGVVAERQMSWGAAGQVAGTVGQAVTAAATRWSFAAEATKKQDSYLLLANATTTDAVATVTYTLADETTVAASYAVPAQSRRTVYTNEVAGLADATFGVVVTSDVALTAERSLYAAGWKSGRTVTTTAAAAGTVWAAAGATAVVVSNPTASAATVQVTVVREGQAVELVAKTVAAQSTVTVDAAGAVFGALVESTNGVAVSVAQTVSLGAAAKTVSVTAAGTVLR